MLPLKHLKELQRNKKESLRKHNEFPYKTLVHLHKDIDFYGH
jgi:hypothetical protein